MRENVVKAVDSAVPNDKDTMGETTRAEALNVIYSVFALM